MVSQCSWALPPSHSPSRNNPQWTNRRLQILLAHTTFLVLADLRYGGVLPSIAVSCRSRPLEGVLVRSLHKATALVQRSRSVPGAPAEQLRPGASSGHGQRGTWTPLPVTGRAPGTAPPRSPREAQDAGTAAAQLGPRGAANTDTKHSSPARGDYRAEGRGSASIRGAEEIWAPAAAVGSHSPISLRTGAAAAGPGPPSRVQGRRRGFRTRLGTHGGPAGLRE